MTAGQQKVEDLLAQTAKEWAQYLIPNFESSVELKKLIREGKLQDSFTFSVTDQGNGSFVINVRFLAYGNVFTRSKVFWTKPANGYALEAWVRKVGVEYFAYVPGYGDYNDTSKFQVSPDQAAKRIAAAIAFQRANGSKRIEYGRQKARNWKRKPLGTGKGYLGHLLRERLAELTKNEIVNALTKD